MAAPEESPATAGSKPESTAQPAPAVETQDAKAKEQSSTGTKEKIDLDLPSSAADGLIKKPFARPLDTARPPPPPQLTPDQDAKYNSVLKTVSSWTEVPTSSAKNAPTAPITDDERMFLTRECLLRYLRATKWNVSEAISRIRATLAWRREYGFEKLTPDYISIENETGKQVILGYDINARPCLYLLPSRDRKSVV